MRLYYQHVGEALSARDFPRSLGEQGGDLRRFRLEDLKPFMPEIVPFELSEIETNFRRNNVSGFQVWGLPEGAVKAVSKMRSGDFLMLLESKHFGYVGRVLHRFSRLSPSLSKHIWKEEKFPIIVFLEGAFIYYPWIEFRDDFGFDDKYHMRGNTMVLGDKRIAESKYRTVEDFVGSLVHTRKF